MKKTDFLLILVVLVVAGGLYLAFSNHAQKGDTARLLVDGQLLEELPLDTDTHYTIQTESGYNTITVQNGVVSMTEADCRDQICVEHSAISKTNETIVCLPHKVVIEVEAAEEAEFDAVVK